MRSAPQVTGIVSAVRSPGRYRLAMRQAVTVVALLLCSLPAGAQTAAPSRRAPVRAGEWIPRSAESALRPWQRSHPVPEAPLSVDLNRLLQETGGRTLEPGVALAASALLPGAGQYLLHNDRWVPYIAFEVWGWLSFLDRRGDARSLAGDYRDLAWSVARRISVGERRDTIFEYYEAMTHFSSSGTWDRDPQTSGVQPELDASTFNGDLWALARSLYFPGGGNYQPGSAPYEQALGYYLVRAIPPTFSWAWGDSNLEQESFRELIRRSDDAYRSSTQVLGLILINHLVSAVDALVIGRLQGRPAESRLRVRSGFENGTGPIPRLRIEARWFW